MVIGQETQSTDEIVEQIFKYVTQISAEHSSIGVIRLLADMARGITHADRCTVWVVSKDKKSLWTYMADGVDAITIPIDSGLVGYAVSQQKRLIVNDAYADPRFNADVDQQTGYRTNNIMVVPMFTEKGEVIGAFQLVNKLPEGSRFEEEHLKYIMLASTYAAETLCTSVLKESCHG